MRYAAVFLSLFLVVIACSTKKTETSTTPVDSLVVDSAMATSPASAALAFAALDGFVAKKNLALPDSINYFLITSQDVLEQGFVRDKNADPLAASDFIINYVIGVACAADRRTTTIVMDKVSTGESSIDVYLTLTRGAAGKTSTAQAQLFVIERREGYPVMQFYVNGKKDKGMVLVESL